MKNYFFSILMICCASIKLHGANAETTNQIAASGNKLNTAMTSFDSTASSLASARPHVEHPYLTGEQKETYEQLKLQATSVMHQLNYAETMLAMFNQYKDQDGYPRQALWYAVFNERKYTKADLPFLKNLLLACWTFREEQIMIMNFKWWNKSRVLTMLSIEIIGLTGGDVDKDGDPNLLLRTGPAAWLAKHAP